MMLRDFINPALFERGFMPQQNMGVLPYQGMPSRGFSRVPQQPQQPTIDPNLNMAGGFSQPRTRLADLISNYRAGY